MKIRAAIFVLLLFGAAVLQGCPWPPARSGPTAAFTATPTRGSIPLEVQFTDRSTTGSATITDWAWDFGDGNSGTAQHPSHTYASIGRFDVVLTVTTSVGSDTQVEAGFVVVADEDGEVEERALSWIQLSPSESFPISLREMRHGGFLYAWNHVVDADSHLSESLVLHRLDPLGRIQRPSSFYAGIVGKIVVEVLDSSVVVLTRGDSDPTSLIKYSQDDVEQWSLLLPDLTRGVDMVDTADGGVMVLGPGASLVKVDAAGEIQWVRSLGPLAGDLPSNVVQSLSGGYIVGLEGQAGANVIGTDQAGEPLWSSRALRDEEMSSIVVREFSDGGIGQSGRLGQERAYLRTLDQNGNEISFMVIDMDVSHSHHAVLDLTTDGGLVIGSFDDSLRVWKIGADGNKKWQANLGDFWFPAYSLSAVLETTDGGVAVTGQYNLFTEYGRAFLLLVE